MLYLFHYIIIFFKKIEIGLYSAIAIYLMGKMIDIIFEGVNFTKMMLIVSNKYKEIAKEIYETEIDVCLKNTITINISRLKKKIGKYIEIKTIRQAGYIVEKSYKR